jgi:DNA-binding LacI/PurR family transcriptional regulator
MGKAAAKLFIELIHNNEDMSDTLVTLKPRLMIRASSQRKK